MISSKEGRRVEVREYGYACDDVMNVTGFIVWASERVVTYCLPMVPL